MPKKDKFNFFNNCSMQYVMSKCSFCNYEAFTKLIDLGKQPFANKYPKKEQFKNEIRTNLTILICQNCFSAKTESIASEMLCLRSISIYLR